MDAETARTLVSAALVSGAAMLGLASLRALLMRVAGELTAARRVPVRIPVRAARLRERPGD